MSSFWSKVESSISRSIKRLHRPPTETTAPLASKSHSNLFTYFDIVSAFHVVKDSHIFCYNILQFNRNCPIYLNTCQRSQLGGWFGLPETLCALLALHQSERERTIACRILTVMQLPVALWIEDAPQETVKRLCSWHCKTFLLGSTDAREGINKTPGGVSSPNIAGIATMCFLQVLQMIEVFKCHIHYKHFRWASSIY